MLIEIATSIVLGATGLQGLLDTSAPDGARAQKAAATAQRAATAPVIDGRNSDAVWGTYENMKASPPTASAVTVSCSNSPVRGSR